MLLRKTISVGLLGLAFVFGLTLTSVASAVTVGYAAPSLDGG